MSQTKHSIFNEFQGLGPKKCDTKTTGGNCDTKTTGCGARHFDHEAGSRMIPVV